MRVVFHIISSGGGSGASRTTRYIAEREKDPTREGPGPRPLFSEDRDNLSYRSADRILDRLEGQPQKDDLLHISVSFQEEDFEKLGNNEQERQAGLRRVIRDGMRGMADELNVEWLTWVAGIHRNTENPHAHIVILNEATERYGFEERDFSRLRSSLLPHKQIVNGKEVIVPGKIGDRFIAALDKQQQRFRDQPTAQQQAREIMEEWGERVRGRSIDPNETQSQPTIQHQPTDDKRTRQFKTRPAQHLQNADYRTTEHSWNKYSAIRPSEDTEYRLALGRYLELSIRLAFAEAWHERATKHGDTYRFEVIDESLGEERKMSELDVHRRASARAQRLGSVDRVTREDAFEADLSRHRETLDQLMEAQEAKIASLGKDVSALKGSVYKVETGLSRRYDTPESRVIPIMDRDTLSKLQATAVRLNLPDRVLELEELRERLAREFRGVLRTDDDAALLNAQVNVARADYRARTTRLENFEASVHLTPYEVSGERWSLGALDKHLMRRREDAKVWPEKAQRLDFRSLARINYLSGPREQAAKDVEHFTFVRGEIVRQIEQRRQPLVNDRERANDLLEILEDALHREKSTRERNGLELPEPKYEQHHIRSLESSAEILRDANLLKEVHELERASPDADWEGRAVAREVMAGIAVEETKERLRHFVESHRFASLNLGEHRTGTLREVEARTVTDYAVRFFESQPQREHRHSITTAGKEHHAHLVADSQKAHDYHDSIREMATEARGHEPNFTDKERMNLEIYAERQSDETIRDQFLVLARGDAMSDREVAVSHER